MLIVVVEVDDLALTASVLGAGLWRKTRVFYWCFNTYSPAASAAAAAEFLARQRPLVLVSCHSVMATTSVTNFLSLSFLMT